VAVTAGRGYGKTSSVYSFLDNNPAVSLWIQLSGQDNVCQRFWENICAIITLQNPELGRAMTGIGFPDSELLFDRFYSMVEKTIRTARKEPALGYVLVYDDFQTISNPAMLRLFDRILASPFPKTSVIIISRTEPQVKTLSLLSKGLLSRITAEDLRFTPEETAAYFALRGLELSPGDMDSLYRDTEGWPRLLDLISQSAGKQAGPFHYSPEMLRVPLFKIIDDLFFSVLDGNTRKFLIQLSLTGYRPLELLGEMEGPAEDLEKINPFIRYDSYLNSYRIHNLFIEFLREKQGELPAEEKRAVFLQSARWCFDNNLRMDAAAYYEKARDYRGLVNLYFSYPLLIPLETAAFLLGIIDRLIRGADENMPEDLSPDNQEALLYLRYAVRVKLLLLVGRFEEGAAVCQEIISQFEALPPGAVNARILASTYVSLGFMHIFTCRTSKNYRFLPFFERAYGYFKTWGGHNDRILSQGIIPSYVCQVGFPAEAGEFEEYLSNFGPAASILAEISGGFLAGQDSLGWCEYYYFKGDLEAAENFARRAIIRARENRQYEAENRGLFFLLRIALHNGNSPETDGLLRQIRTQLETGDHQNGPILCDLEYGWFYAQTGNPAAAAAWIRGEGGESGLGGLNRPLEILVRAKCLFAEKNYQAALDILEQWEQGGAPRDCLLGKLEMTVLEAACSLRLERRGAALEKLGEAWALSAAHGLDMPFIEMGEEMRLLAAAALEGPAGNPGGPPEASKRPMPREWLETLRSKAAAYGKTLTVFKQGRQEPSDDGAAVLRPSEAAVLRALSQGLTREEIAGGAGLSLHGVKEIIKNLYRKLGAVNRADAVRIAIDRGFLKNSRR
jgi:LuxR family maltose regulon positive regulatory protein